MEKSATSKPTSQAGPLYNPAQTDDERRDFENLILLCGNHHTVIDADDEAYTVDRLKKMKRDHESIAKQVDDLQAASAAILLLDQSVETHNQSGGITAHTVNAKEINIISQSSPNVSLRKERAVNAIWQNTVALRNEYADVGFIDLVLTPEEINAFLSNGASHPVFDSVAQYASLEVMAGKANRTIIKETQNERPFVSDRAWALFQCLQAINSRAGFLLNLSFKRRKYENWRDDHGIDAHLRAVLRPDELAALKSSPHYSLKVVLDHLEQLFVAETRRPT